MEGEAGTSASLLQAESPVALKVVSKRRHSYPR